MKLSDVDQILIRYADTLSPLELSFKVEGILTPEQCGARIARLLDAPDWLTEAQQDRLVTMKMRVLITQLEEMTLTSRVAEIIIRALESLGARLDRRAAATDKELKTLYAFQGTVLLDAVEAALNHISEKVELSTTEWDNLKISALRSAQLELAAHETVEAEVVAE